jgi:excinuclease ABC subunit B
MKKGGGASPSPGGGGSTAAGGRGGVSRSGGASSPSPLAGEGRGGGSTSRAPSKVHKPHLDEMHGPESLPYRPTRAVPRKPELTPGSKIFQPTDSRQSGPEFGPAPRSSGGAPGHRGGWKKR